MFKAIFRALFGPIFAMTLVLSTNGANGADLPPAKPLSLDCTNRVQDPSPNTQIPHQYMLLLVFKKDAGKSYFGGATSYQSGCIDDVEFVPNTTGAAQRLRSTGHKLTVSNCPNDCVYPRTAHAPLNEGSDPLNTDKSRTIPWGILSAVDSAPVDGGPGRRIEIWEVAVKDACHARQLYAYHNQCLNSVLRRALNNHAMLGEILVGYRDPQHANGDTTACPAIKTACTED